MTQSDVGYGDAQKLWNRRAQPAQAGQVPLREVANVAFVASQEVTDAIATLEVENRALRARNERLEAERRDLVEAVAQRLLQAGQPAAAGLIREVFR